MAPPARGRFERVLAHPRALLGIVLLAVLLGLPSLRIGFYADDYALVAMAEQRITALHASPTDLYRMVGPEPAEGAVLFARGPLPWWSDPGLRIRFFRPLTSLLFTLDHTVHGRDHVGYHVTTIALFALVVLSLSLLYRQILASKGRSGDDDPSDPRLTATLALLVFTVDGAHVHALDWISARHLSITAIPVILGLTAHLRHHREGWSPGRFLGPLGLLVAFCCGESAMVGACLWLAHDLLGPAPAVSANRSPRRARLLSSLPPVVIVCAYALLYKRFGYGVHGSASYLDPSSDPIAFVLALGTRVPPLVANLLVGVPSDLTAIVPPAPFVIAGLLATALFVGLYRSLRPMIAEREHLALRWMIPGALAGLALSSAGFVGARLLFLPSIAGALLIAVMIRAASRRIAARPAGTRLLGLRVARGALITVHLILAPLNLVNTSVTIAGFARAGEAAARSIELSSRAPTHAVVVWASDPQASFYPPSVMLFDAPPHPDDTWHVVSTSKGSQQVTRTGPSSLKVKSLDRPMLQSGFDQVFYQTGTRFQVGDSFAQQGMTITVTAAEGGAPTEIEASFTVPLEDPSLSLVAWMDGKLRRIPALKVGESTRIEWSPGPYRFF